MQLGGHELFLIMFWTAFIGVLWIPITWLMLSIFTPKQLLDRYFKEPHFTQGELIMMAGYPFFLMRTAMFGWATIFPRVGKKRQIIEPTKYMPIWYVIGLRILTLGSTLTLLIFLGIMAYLFIVDPAP